MFKEGMMMAMTFTAQNSQARQLGNCEDAATTYSIIHYNRRPKACGYRSVEVAAPV
jgi:hypothetical protein